MCAEIKYNTEKWHITIFSNLLFLSSSEGSYESGHGPILAKPLTALKRDKKWALKSNLTLKNRNLKNFSNLTFLSSSEGSYESAHGHILVRNLTALKRDKKWALK